MIGSTAGGIKFDRVYLFFVSLRNQLRLILHPNGVYAVKMNGKSVDHAIELQVMVFIILYLLTLSGTVLLLTGMGIDGMTSFSASITTIGNVGPGIRARELAGEFWSPAGCCQVYSFGQHAVGPFGNHERVCPFGDAIP